MEKIILFNGSNKDFKKVLQEYNIADDNYTPFMELIRQYNSKVRANDIYATPGTATDDVDIENAVIFADEFASVMSHVLSNFSNIVLQGHNIVNLFIQNPPKRVERSLNASFADLIEKRKSNYFSPSTSAMLNIINSLRGNDSLVGQKQAKEKIFTGLYKYSYLKHNEPLVQLFFGPSGVGKTQFAKELSKHFGGKLTRIQFSMMHTSAAYDYIYGGEHNKPSLALDILGRETNIILMDEFDKTDPIFYNAFYRMFDEGIYEDVNYKVDVSNCIFILTSNFENEKNIASSMGMPLYSRIDQKIQFSILNEFEIRKIINDTFENLLSKLTDEDKEIINNSHLLSSYIDSAKEFHNISMLDKSIETDIFSTLLKKKLN